MQELEIIYKDENIVVVNKPAGVPSQEDKTADASVLRILSEQLTASGQSGEVYAVHRLDRGVSGLMAVARNKKSAAAMSAAVSERALHKQYLAVVRGVCEGGRYTDYLFKDSATNKSYAVKTKRQGAKLAELDAYPVASRSQDGKDYTLLRIELHTGRHHQIRAQLSSRGTPIIGDKKYGGMDKSVSHIALHSFKLSFALFGRDFDLTRLPCESEYPFSIFKEEITKL